MPLITKIEDLECWKSARILNRFIANLFSQNELKNQFIIGDQAARASLSIMNNIAEGFGRFNILDSIRFYNIAAASCSELKSIAYSLYDAEKIDSKTFEELKSLINSTTALTLGFIRYLKTKNNESK